MGNFPFKINNILYVGQNKRMFVHLFVKAQRRVTIGDYAAFKISSNFSICTMTNVRHAVINGTHFKIRSSLAKNKSLLSSCKCILPYSNYFVAIIMYAHAHTHNMSSVRVCWHANEHTHIARSIDIKPNK